MLKISNSKISNNFEYIFKMYSNNSVFKNSTKNEPMCIIFILLIKTLAKNTRGIILKRKKMAKSYLFSIIKRADSKYGPEARVRRGHVAKK